MRPLTNTLLGTLLAGSLIAVTSSASAYAKTPAPPGATPPAAAHHDPDELKRFEEAAAKLDLSAEQKSKVARLVQEVRASVKKIESAPGDPAQRQERLKAIRNDAKEKLDHILTVAQDRQLKKLLSPHHPSPKAGAK